VTTRELLWNVPVWAEVVMYAGAGVAILLLIAYAVRRVMVYRKGRRGAARRTDHLPARVWDFVLNGLLQKAVLENRYAGVMHLAIFWGFTVLLIGTIILIFVIDFGLHFFTGRFYLGFSFIMEIGGLALLLGVLLAAVRRYVRRPATLERRWYDHYPLIMLFVIGITGFLMEGARIYAAGLPEYERVASFVGYGLARGFATIASPEGFATFYRYVWIFHMLITLGFIGLLGFTKFLHVFTAPANVFLRDRRPKGAMTFVPNVEETDELGVGTITAYSWPDLEDLDACTRCGRCEEVCPATASGKPLNPKNIVLKSRQILQKREAEAMRALLRRDSGRGSNSHRDPSGSPQGAPDLFDLIEDDEAWSCTTCRSCVEHCPVAINQLDKVLELRRYLTNEGRLAGSAAKALESMGMRGNPWQLKQSDRMAWTQGLDVDVPVLAEIQDVARSAGATGRGAEPEPVDYLFFVGCAGSYDPRAQKGTQALVRLLARAGVSFAVLGEEETCCCEAGRRMGEEMLFQVGAGTLKETIDQYRFRGILTQCPHCYNAFRNDYPQLGADWKVTHHSELLQELVSSGRLPTMPSSGSAVAYHDSCYLGRYNDIYRAPRDVLAGAGLALKEPRRHGRDGFCCGGGGGQMWSELKIGEPIEYLRIRELLETGAQGIATACPYCRIMLDDGVKHEGLEEQLIVQDVAEILDQALAGSSGIDSRSAGNTEMDLALQ
jgi:Fe-S oxidoreductase/nitrate reductase gamma subunit